MLKRGKEEIIYLLNKCIEKFQEETGKSVIQNTNRKNYEALAIHLSEISNLLPTTHEAYGHTIYESDPQFNKANYPFRKYDITGGQIKDALMGLVANPRPFLIDTCYIYLYGVGRQAFELNPVDVSLVASETSHPGSKDSYSIITENQQLKLKLASLVKETDKKIFNRLRFYRMIFIPLCVCLLVGGIYFWKMQNESITALNTISKDFNIMPYKVTPTEKDNIEGIWLCYTGSPQARPSDPNRYHKVVANLVEIKFKDGYFTYYRYGAGFNHTGYVQFESPNVLSIHSRIMNGNNKTEYPRHSLMSLTKNTKYETSISASWNFDAGNNKRIIGIREVYEKIGTDGRIEEIINTPANASCQCKIIKWYQKNNDVQTFYLKNTILDSAKNVQLSQLIDDNSILLKDPETGVVIH
ncbi:MAG: hypothetical protein WBH12_08775 [Sediminibacterium sp.]